MNTSTNHPNCREALRDLMGDALMRGELDATDELLIAGVLAEHTRRRMIWAGRARPA